MNQTPLIRFLSCFFVAGVVFPLNFNSMIGGNCCLAQQTATRQENSDDEAKLLFEWSSQDKDADKSWEFKDGEAWKFEGDGKDRILTQFVKASSYKPPHRSPTHMALLKDKTFESFQLDVELKSTHEDYGHRDVCLYFGFQDPAKFYYVHMAKAADPHANQIFIVNQADRTKITTKTTDGTPWDDQWHHVRMVRDCEKGSIEVFFDDMNSPIMKANDKNFKAGRIGFGSFDDTAAFRKVTVKELKK